VHEALSKPGNRHGLRVTGRTGIVKGVDRLGPTPEKLRPGMGSVGLPIDCNFGSSSLDGRNFRMEETGEADVSTEQARAQASARVSRSDGDSGRT
jgi:hypothetical protein